MAKWDLNKLPEGRKPLPDSWFAERAQMQDRINGLEELLLAATNDAKEAEAYAGELEAKLAKAVEALGDIVKDCEADYPPSHGAIRYFARTTLAELTGGKDE